jgi:gliding motility-associated-like protein
VYKKPVFFLAFIFLSLQAFATVFTVTSNADSGAGTLRDALTQAAGNGTATIDYIYFNLPDTSLTGRTIALQTQLPALTSNLVIDGTTQPGATFGVSDAKVKITTTFVNPTNLNILYCNGCDGIQVYGLWLWGNMIGWGGSALHFRNFGKITIGGPSKGNLIEWGNIGIDTGKSCIFQNNVCWTNVTGDTCRYGNITYLSCDTITLGGLNEGNVLAGTTNMVFSSPATSVVNISYNKWGTNFAGTASPEGFYVEQARLYMEGASLLSGQSANEPVSTLITNNIFADVYDADFLDIGGLGGKAVIQGNAFNTDFSGQLNLNVNSHGGAYYGISGSGNIEMIVGGDLPIQKNVIAYCLDGILNGTTGKFLITRNSIFCYGEEPVYASRTDIPVVKINKVTPNLITGTSTPNAIIELFNADCSCYNLPSPRTYFTTVNADQNGNWSYSGQVSGYIMATPTLDSLTGIYAGLNIDNSNLKIQNATCTATGSITGIQTPVTSGFQWFNSQNQLVGTNIDLLNVVSGVYTLEVNVGTSCSLTQTYTIEDNSITVDTTGVALNSPSCNQLGSITGISVTTQSSQYFTEWVDQNGKVLCNCVDLTSASPGAYTFKVGNSDGTCSQSFGPFVLNATSGPNINQSKAAIQSTDCGQSTGSITGITATGTGTLSYIWWNGQQQKVGVGADLLNQPPGTYQLEVTDQSQCGAVYTTDFIIAETNGITLNDGNVQITPSSCSKNNGAITGITAAGATVFQWVNANNYPEGTMLNLLNVGPGTYTLAASNSAGCSVTSKSYTVEQIAPPQFPVYQVNIYQACTGKPNGGVEVLVDTLVKQEQWVNQLGQVIGNGIGISGVPAGIYLFYVSNANGCTVLYGTYEVPSIPQLTIDQGSAIVTNDQCSRGKGSITGIAVSGGRPPYVYQWLDASGNPISSSTNISGLSIGSYTFTVNDATTCGIVSATFTITNQDVDLPTPAVNNLQVCSQGGALLQVKNPQNGYGYRLYSSETDTIPLEQQANGSFNITVKNDETLYVSEFAGSCESNRTAVQISVGISSINISNTFTPNGDGINDYWIINGIAGYPAAEVQVFTRWGQKVFDSKGYATPFDGTYSGKKLPDGVYYYIINLNSNCNLLSGSLTIIR